MVGVTLSRWTMTYFATALAALIGTECLMVAGYGYPAVAFQAPQTLIVVHLAVIGWLSMLMCGALFQFVPVLIARRLYSDALPLPTWILLVSGLTALILGFLQLAGTVPSHAAWAAACLPIAAVLLGTGFTLAIWNLARTLWDARPLALPARFVTAGLFCLGATVTFGVIFALVLGGVTAVPQLLDVIAAGVPIHVIAGLGGWLTLTAWGVSYRLLAMFMLAPELNGPATRGAFYLSASALAVAILGGVAAICLSGSVPAVLGVAGLLGLAAAGCYARDIVHLYRARKRRHIELNSRMAAVALANLAAAVVLIIGLLGFGLLDRHAGAVVFLFGFGWLSGLALAKLYKIVAFLTWLECYGPVLGKTPTPRVQDLVIESRAIKWFWLYFAAVWSATLGLLMETPLAFRVAAAVMVLATCGIAAQFVRTRRLADVKAGLRFPAGVRAPRLLLTSVQQT